MKKENYKQPKIWRPTYNGIIYGRKLIWRLLKEELGEPAKKYNVLDVGSMGGGWIAHMEAYAAQYTGLDVVKDEFVTVVASAEKMPFEDNTFDLVFSNAVLEHIRDYRAAIAEMHRVVKPDGVIILGTHGTWEIHGEPHDFWRWTPYGLREIFSAFPKLRIVQAGGPMMNYFLFRYLYLRRWQERHPALRALVSPWIILNNLIGSIDGEATETPTALAAFYYVIAREA